MIGDTAFMFTLKPGNVFRIEQAAPAQALRRKQIMRQRPQFTLQPLGKGNAETLLAAPPNESRHQAFRRALENVF